MSRFRKGWRRVKFGEVVRLVTNRCDPTAAGIERFVGLENLEPGNLRVRSWGLVAEGTTFTNRFRPGQVLFGKRRAYQKKVAVADFEGVCSGDIYVLESSDPARLQPDLLPFLCQTDAFFEHAVGTSAGSLSPRTNWDRLAKYNFALPPMEEQRRIAGLLCASDSIRAALSEGQVAAKRATDALLEERLTTLRNECPPVPVTEVLRRLTVGIVVKPANWYTESEDGVAALRSLNVQPGELVMSDLVRITPEGHRTHTKSSLSAGDVVVVRTGRPGDAAVIPSELGPMNCIDLIVTTPGEKLRPRYFTALLNSSVGKRVFSLGTAGTAQQHFNVGAFKQMTIPVPALEAQDVLVEEHDSMASAVLQMRRRTSDADHLHETLLRGLFA